MKARLPVVVLGLLLTGVACGSGAGLGEIPAGGEASGEEVFGASGCSGCHVEPGGAVAPSLLGLYGSEVLLEDGETVVADEAYLRESIVSPGTKLVSGYQRLMPEFQGLLTDEQVDALIAYIRSPGD